jgi:CHASE3 domain sensor protein
MGLPTMFGAIVLLVSATLMLGANISALRANLVWLKHSQQVLSQVDILEAAMLSEELTVRGYALTGDQRFSRYQQDERGRCRAALAELSRLAAADERRAPEFAAVQRYNTEHLAVFGKFANIGPNHAAVVAAAIVDPAVRENMRRTRKSIEALRAAALNDLAERQRAITDQIGRAFFLGVGIIVAAFLLGGVGLWTAQLKAPHRL